MFKEEMRYDYPLTEDSLVFDVGGFNGEFAEGIIKKYGCRVHLFEPVYWMTIKEIPGLVVNKFGLAGSNRHQEIHIKGNATSIFGRGISLPAEFVKCSTYLMIHDICNVDLIKINIEGMEYELLTDMIKTDAISKFNHVQIQFHKLPDQETLRDMITEQLEKTHVRDWCYDWIWESWSRK